MEVVAHRDISRAATLTFNPHPRPNRRCRRYGFAAPAALDLAIVDILGAILRAVLFMTRTRPRARTPDTPTRHRWGA